VRYAALIVLAWSVQNSSVRRFRNAWLLLNVGIALNCKNLCLRLNESNHVSSVHIHTIYFFVTMVWMWTLFIWRKISCRRHLKVEGLVSHLLIIIKGKKMCKVDSSCKKPLVICSSVFSMFLNPIKGQEDQKIIIWIEYFPYEYSFKVISNY
jgi:hypothetical protein